MKNFLSLAVALFTAVSALAQFNVSGSVQNKSTGNPIADVAVYLTIENKRLQVVTTDNNGEFVFRNVANGSYVLYASAAGLSNISKNIIVAGNNLTGNQLMMEEAVVVGNEVLVQSTRAADATPVTHTNITRKEIEKQNFGQDLPFLLNLTPSTVVSSDAGGGVGYTSIRIRGTDPARTNVTINGVPINDAESHGMFWVNMPDIASSSQNIQVQRGVGTSANGAGAFGASINIQSDGLNVNPYAEVSNGFGSFNTWKHTVKAGTGLQQNGWAFDVRLSKIASDGYIDRASSDLKSFFLSGARYGKKSLLKINVFSGTEKTYQAWNGIYEDILRQGNRTHNDYTYQNQTDNYQQDYYQLFYTYMFNRYLKANIGLHYTYGRGYYEEFREDESFTTYKLSDSVIVNGDTLTSGDFIRRRWLKNDFYGTVFSFIYEKNKLNLTLGGGFNQYDGIHFGELIWAEYAQGSNINDHFYDGKSVKNDFNIYAKATYRITEKLEGFVDLQQRMINYKLNGEDLNSGVYMPYNFNLDYNFFNPKAGVTYKISERSDVYAYFGIANKEPVRNDIIQASVTSIPRPEQLINYEFGYRRNWRNAAVSVNVYYMDYKDQLVTTGALNDVGAYNRMNVAESYRSGVELTGGVKVLPKLRWQVTATYSRNRIVEFTEYLDDWDNGGQVTTLYKDKAIAFSPDLILSSLITFTPINNLDIDLITKYVGEQYLDNTQSAARMVDAFLVNDVRIGYEFPLNGVFRSVRAGVLINNVFDEQYESGGATYPGGISGGVRSDYNYYYTQAGTNFLTSLTLKF